MRIEIPMPNLHDLQLSGGSHGVVKGFYSLHSLVLSLSGSSHIETEGTANDLSISASGGSHLELSNFPLHNANVILGGGSCATIEVDWMPTGGL